ncbi:unnamed protein product [Ilex paraguariensis]|uniref:Uncharacterized protein n=1 Tax=Ilex paraguariensis TaxID=185542 RepID=A0ABC8SBZ0_9AQUA
MAQTIKLETDSPPGLDRIVSYRLIILALFLKLCLKVSAAASSTAPCDSIGSVAASSTARCDSVGIQMVLSSGGLKGQVSDPMKKSKIKVRHNQKVQLAIFTLTVMIN